MYRLALTWEKVHQRERGRERVKERETERPRAVCDSRAALNVKCANYGARATAIECDCDCDFHSDCDCDCDWLWMTVTHTLTHLRTQWACQWCNLAAFCFWRQTNALIFIASPTAWLTLIGLNFFFFSILLCPPFSYFFAPFLHSSFNSTSNAHNHWDDRLDMTRVHSKKYNQFKIQILNSSVLILGIIVKLTQNVNSK